MDHELKTYNPYFGCDIISITINNNLITIKYEEKYSICEVILRPETDPERFTKRLLYSTPNTFSRLLSSLTKNHEIGEIIHFIRDGKEMTNKTYHN